MDDYVITYSNDGLAIVDIVMEELQGMWVSLVGHLVVEGIISPLALNTLT